MPYCENCGKPLKETAKFCGNCGNSVESSVKAEPVSAPVEPESAEAESSVSEKTQETSLTEPVVSVLMLRKPKSLGRYDTYSGVLTNQRLVFAQMTSSMLKDAIKQAKEQAKANGKGFFGQWKEQLKVSASFSQRYYSIEPSVALSETAGNFELKNSAVNEIKLKLKTVGNPDNNQREFEVEFKGTMGKYKYRMAENNNYVNALKQIYGDRVKTPRGYFSKGGLSFRIG